MGFDNSMKFYSKFRMVAMLAAALMAVGTRAEAQDMWLNVIVSANPVGISNNLTYTITVTNLTGASQTVVVTNTMPATAQFVSVGFGLVSYPYTVNGSNITFSVGTLTNGGLAQMGVTIEPTATGTFTNTIVVTTNGVAAIVAPISIQVTNGVGADLAVAITVPASAVFTNDWVTYGVNVTNLGPASASNVMLTNMLPPGVILKSVSPTNQSATSSNLIFNVGTLTNGAFKNYRITIVPTNAGLLAFTAGVNSTNVTDPNPDNNLASNNITVNTFIYGQLIATNYSTNMTYNPQTGLMEQTIRLTNIGTNAVAAARVIVSGLTNRLYNAIGTNSGNPYVVYGAALDTNQFVDLVLEYFIPTRQSIFVANSNYTAVGVSNIVLSAASGTNGSFNITLVTNLPSGYVLIEFQSTLGSNYTILYSTNLLNWLEAQPSIVAPANRVQWIDDGPPKTVSAPTNTSLRYYRVRLNQ
jgi:uncharacterized repeat protein (TIGR01451 family)